MPAASEAAARAPDSSISVQTKDEFNKEEDPLEQFRETLFRQPQLGYAWLGTSQCSSRNNTTTCPGRKLTKRAVTRPARPARPACPNNSAITRMTTAMHLEISAPYLRSLNGNRQSFPGEWRRYQISKRIVGKLQRALNRPGRART